MGVHRGGGCPSRAHRLRCQLLTVRHSPARRGYTDCQTAAIPARGYRATQRLTTMSTDTVRVERSDRPGRWVKYTLSRPRADMPGKVDHYSITVDRCDGTLHVEARMATVSRGGHKTTTSPALSPAELRDTDRASILAAMPADHAALCLAAVAAYVPPPPPAPVSPLPADFVTRELRAIAACHAADVESGLSEADADESDAFQRHALGLDYED